MRLALAIPAAFLSIGCPSKMQPTGGAGDAGLESATDEFEDAGTLASWGDLFPALHDSLSIDGVAPGKLSMTPVPVDQTTWYADDHGPFLYKTVNGDFRAEIDVAVGRRTDMTQPPRGQYNQAGLVVRDPASTAPGHERWIMYNLGFQNTAFAREAKTTRPGQSGSLSTLYLVETAPGVYSGKLRVCRVGDTFYVHHQMSGETGWTEEAYGGNTVPMGNGAGEATPGVTAGGAIRFQRADMPAAVQLGMLVGNWGAPLEARGEFGYLRLAAVASPADCSVP